MSEEGRMVLSLPNHLRDEIKVVRDSIERAYKSWRAGEVTDDQWRTFVKLVEQLTGGVTCQR